MPGALGRALVGGGKRLGVLHPAFLLLALGFETRKPLAAFGLLLLAALA